jgi:ERCC4-type nuclease
MIEGRMQPEKRPGRGGLGREAATDTREPEPHPWLPFLPEGWSFERARLKTGDLALAVLPQGAVVERKTPSDLVSCMTSSRERFERELARSRYLGRFVVVVEGGLPDVLAARRAMSDASVIGTIAAWQRRYTGFFFAGSIRIAAEFSFRFLAGQVAEIQRVHRNISSESTCVLHA